MGWLKRLFQRKYRHSVRGEGGRFSPANPETTGNQTEKLHPAAKSLEDLKQVMSSALGFSESIEKAGIGRLKRQRDFLDLIEEYGEDEEEESYAEDPGYKLIEKMLTARQVESRVPSPPLPPPPGVEIQATPQGSFDIAEGLPIFNKMPDPMIKAMIDKLPEDQRKEFETAVKKLIRILYGADVKV